jgi:hypothetical protein
VSLSSIASASNQCIPQLGQKGIRRVSFYGSADISSRFGESAFVNDAPYLAARMHEIIIPMPRKAKENSSLPEPNTPTEESILAAFEKLFKPGEPGLRRFKPSGVRYVNLSGGAILVEQNPNKRSQWAMLARQGHRIAWVMRDGEYLARVVDGEVQTLGKAHQSQN